MRRWSCCCQSSVQTNGFAGVIVFSGCWPPFVEVGTAYGVFSCPRRYRVRLRENESGTRRETGVSRCWLVVIPGAPRVAFSPFPGFSRGVITFL